MSRRQQAKSASAAGELTALRSVRIATGGQGKVEELYRVMGAEEAARFLGLALQTVRNRTARGELPVIRTGKRGVGYRLVDLIAWQEARLRPVTG